MSRYLFVVPPFSSHIFPTVSVADELAQRGHAVAWVTYPQMRNVLPAGAAFFPVDSPIPDEDFEDIKRDTGAAWFVGMKALYERVIVRLAVDMLPFVETAIDRFQPDVMIVDQIAVAGALAARRKGRKWATSASTGILTGLGVEQFPKAEDWVRGLFDKLQRDAGLAPVPWPDRSPELVILYTSRALAGADIAFPPHYCFVGPALTGRSEQVDGSLAVLPEGRRVFVSLGTLWAFRGERFFRTLVEALADAPLTVLVHAPAEYIPSPPHNFIVRSWFPVTQLFPQLDAVVCHAGSMVNEALAYGIPAVVAPIIHDQGHFAERAVAAGAARRIRFRRVTAVDLRDAVFAVLDDVAYRAAARKVATSFREAGGAPAAATAIEQMQ